MKNLPAIQEPNKELIEIAESVRDSANYLGQTSDQERKKALHEMADALWNMREEIVEANAKDQENALAEGLSFALLSRLKLDNSKLQGAIDGVKKLADLQDPLGICQLNRELNPGLLLERITVPLGVLGVIFEARPDAVIQIASLAIRSGNGALLKGGREANLTNNAVMVALKKGLSLSTVNPHALSLLTTREESLSLLRLDRIVDLIIPRGSNQLVRFIQENTRIPVLGHADGICHLYIDSDADINEALAIAIDSKTQYPAACNAIETLLLHEEIAEEFLQKAIPIFESNGVSLLGDERSQIMGIKKAATEKDWSTEYLDLFLAVKVVSDIDQALQHIRRYGSRHTEAIATRNKETAELFLRSVDSAGVFHNCSTRFADGFRFGFGAEVGISTQTLPPRGPVGLDGLVTYRYRLRGNGHLVSDFADGKKTFSHKDLSL